MISIKRISIHNFRQYKDVDLDLNDENGLYLFIGKNGMGKSNFLNAMCWCLYQTEPFRFHQDEKKLLLNEETAKKTGQYEEVSVEIEVSLDTRSYLFKRIWRETWDDAKFLVMFKNNEDWIEVEDPILIRNSFLPQTISKFFLFDGEAVQNLYKGDYAQNLRDGIRRVSDISLLDSSAEHISKTYEDLRRIVSGDNPVASNLEDEFSKLVENKNILESQNLSDKKLVGDLKEQIIKLNEQLGKYKKYSEFQEAKRQLTQDINDTNSQIDTYKKQIDNNIIEYAPFWFLKEELIETAKQIGKENLKGELPPKIKDSFIEELLEDGKCICGTPILKGEDAYKHLMKLKAKISPLNERIFLIEDNFNINSLIKKIDREVYENLKEIRANRAKARERLNLYETRLREIEEKLVNAPEPAVGDIQLTLNKCNEQIDAKLREIGQHEFELKQTDVQIKELQEKINRINQGKARFELENKKVNFLEESRDKIEYVREKIIEQVRKSVSLNTDKYFKDLIWEKDKFNKVSFTETYDVEVIKNGGLNSLRNLSYGEMKVLSFATIKALDLLSGFAEVPLFIDGPLENLDEQVQGNFLDLLPSFLENKQVLIFSLDKPVIIEFAKKHIKPTNFYRLSRDNESKSTIIDKYE